MMQSQFRHYNIIAPLDQQAQSSKYLVSSRETPDKNVVLKVFQEPVSMKLEQQEKIFQAIKSLSSIGHPHIVPVLEAGLEDGKAYVVSEYMPGDSLRVRLEQAPSERLAFQQVMPIITRIGQALAYLHSQHIFHWQLSPEHILFDAKGQAFLSGLYNTHTLGLSDDDKDISADALRYLPPEQCEATHGQQISGALSDQYALCCVIYELLIGQPPFTDINVLALEEKLMRAAPASLISVGVELPVTVNEAILKGLAKDPARRYPDISAFLTVFQSAPDLPDFPVPRAQRLRRLAASSPSLPPEKTVLEQQPAQEPMDRPTEEPLAQEPGDWHTEMRLWLEPEEWPDQTAPSGRPPSSGAAQPEMFDTPSPVQKSSLPLPSSSSTWPGGFMTITPRLLTASQGLKRPRNVLLLCSIGCLAVYLLLAASNPPASLGKSIQALQVSPTSVPQTVITPIVVSPTAIPTRAPTPKPTAKPKPKPTAKPVPTPTPTVAVVVPPPAVPTPTPPPPPTPTPIQPFFSSQWSAQATQANTAVSAYAPGLTVGNVRIESNVTTQGDGGGIIFRSAYRLRIGTDGTYDLVTSAHTLASGSSSAIRTGNNVPNHVTIVAVGNRITILINGQVLINITDNSSSSGSLAVMAVNFGHSTTTTCSFNLYKV